MRTLLILLCLASACPADDGRFQKVLDAATAAKAAALKAKDSEIQRLVRSKAGGAAVRKAKSERDELAKGDVFPYLTLPLTDGDVGQLPGNQVRVVQVINEEEMIAGVATGIGRDGITYGTSVWLKGTATTGVADDTVRGVPGVWEIAGTKTFATAIGASRTIFVVRPFDVGAFDAWRKAKKK